MTTRYLLDTNVILMAFEKSPRLSKKAIDTLRNPACNFFCSIASAWEMAIKAGTGKLTIPDNLLETLKVNNVELLPISVEHACAVRSLPRLHGDPFDRMLVVQAMMEDLTIMTHDRHLAAYSVPCVMV
jgi:PIN domain nuclease of toxin-antitoxin system